MNKALDRQTKQHFGQYFYKYFGKMSRLNNLLAGLPFMTPERAVFSSAVFGLWWLPRAIHIPWPWLICIVW